MWKKRGFTGPEKKTTENGTWRKKLFLFVQKTDDGFSFGTGEVGKGRHTRQRIYFSGGLYITVYPLVTPDI